MNNTTKAAQDFLKENPSLSIGNGGSKAIQWDELGETFVLFKSGDDIQTVYELTEAEIYWLSN